MRTAAQKRDAQQRRKRRANPFSVWPADRERTYIFPTFDRAEDYARRSLRRMISDDGTVPPVAVSIEHNGTVVAHIKLTFDDRIMVDLTFEGAVLV